MYEFLWKALPRFEEPDPAGGGASAETKTEETPPATGDNGVNETSPKSEEEEIPSALGETPPKKEEETPAEIKAEDIKLPEGLSVGEEEMTSFLSILNDAELSPTDRANKLVESYTAVRKAEFDQWIKDQKAARDYLTKESDIGGAKWDENSGRIAAVIQEYCPNPDKFFQALTVAGMGNNYELASLLLNVSKLVSEGKPVVGAPTSEQPPTLADKMFPDQGKV